MITLAVPGASQAQDGAYTAISGTPVNQTNGTANGNVLAADAAHGTPDAANQASTSQASSAFCMFRHIQKRQAEFIKKRIRLLEKAVNTEYSNEVLVSSVATSITCLLCLFVDYLLISVGTS